MEIRRLNPHVRVYCSHVKSLIPDGVYVSILYICMYVYRPFLPLNFKKFIFEVYNIYKKKKEKWNKLRLD